MDKHLNINTHMITQCQAAYAEGVTTRADARTALVKFRCGKCLAPLIVDEDIVYSPKKYRETEGIKEIELKAWLQNQCLMNG